MTADALALLKSTAFGILSRYAPPPLPIQEYRRRVAEAEKERKHPGRVTVLRMQELHQSVLQAMADPEWKRHDVLSRAFYDAGSCAIKVDEVSFEILTWADRLAAIGEEVARG